VFAQLLGLYLIIAIVCFGVCLKSFLADGATPKNDRSSWIALVILPLIWPIVIPIAGLELTNFHK